MKKEYISPKVIAREVQLDTATLISVSDGTQADSTKPVLSKHGSKFNSADFESEEEEF